MPTPSAVILLVDDDLDDVHFMRRALEKAQVRQAVRVAADGQQAIEYLEGKGEYADRRRHPFPCLVVLDLKLPKKSGLEVLGWIRGHPSEVKDLPVVMLTSSDEPRDREAAARHGIESYEVKPVTFDALVQLAGKIRDEAADHCKAAAPCPEEGRIDP